MRLLQHTQHLTKAMELGLNLMQKHDRHLVMSDHPTAMLDHHRGFYTTELYRVIAPDVELMRPPSGKDVIDAALLGDLAKQLAERGGLFHEHWPEISFLGLHVELHQAFADALEQNNVPIVSTEHNLINHHQKENPSLARLAREIHRIWARKTWVAIHHTNSGLRAYCDAYADDFQTEVAHLVIPHGLSRYTADEVARASLELNAIEADLGIQPVPSGGLRIGIFGSPRRERLTRMEMEAFASSGRDDLQLAVFSLGPEDRVPE
jgi:hypothetical protein